MIAPPDLPPLVTCSWWAAPDVQASYAAFAQALAENLARMTANGGRMSWPIDYPDRHLMKPTRH